MLTLLATDIDGTLVGDDEALNRLKPILAKLRETSQLKLVYVTGRSLEFFEEVNREHDLPVPDALLTAVGSEIYIDGKRLTDWPVVTGWNSAVAKAVIESFEGIEQQPDSEQRDHKLCYYFTGDDGQLTKMQSRLGADYTIIYSGNRYLDILPTGIDKGSAIEYLCQQWGLPTSLVIACGDSGNDIAMLDKYKAIIVGNASNELDEWHKTQDNPDIYKAAAGQAGGIIEGLQYFGVID